MSNLLGIKKILLYKLINIVRPFIYEGILSVYLDAENIAQEDEILMVFQGLLSRIPKWVEEDILKEVTRIKTNCKCLYLENLVRSIIKINIQIFLEETKDTFVDPKLYEKVELKDFIHKVYILVARRIFNNPILFYKELNDIDVLNNMNQVMNLIGDEIENAILELLPLDYLIDEYLNEEVYNKQLNLKIPNESIENLQQMKAKINMLEPINDIRIKMAEGPSINNQLPKVLENLNQPGVIPINQKQVFPLQLGGKKHKSRSTNSSSKKSSRRRSSRRRSSRGSSSSSRRRSSRRRSSRRKSSRRQSSSRRRSSSRQKGGRRSSYSKNSSSDRIQRNVKKFLDNSKGNQSSMIDNIIKNKHKEAINIKHDPETSLSYDIENSKNFQEIFSNDKEIRLNNNVKKKNVNFGNSKDNHLFTRNNSIKNNNKKNFRQLYKKI